MMLKEFSLGIAHFFAAFGFLASKRLLRYYLYPLMAVVVLYIGLFGTMLVYSRDIVEYCLGDYLPKEIPEVNSLGSFGRFISHISVYGLLSIVFSLLIFLLAGKMSKYIILILLSPVFALLSEAVEEKASGRNYPFKLHEFIIDVFRGIVLAIRNFAIETLWLGLLGLLGLFFPALSLALTPLGIIISAYFYGFSMIDYINERRRKTIGESVRHIRRHRWFAIGNGLMYWLFDMIPLVGWLIAPVNSVTGACTGILELEQ